MKRTAIWILWPASLLLAFVLGQWAAAPAPVSGPTDPLPVDAEALIAMPAVEGGSAETPDPVARAQALIRDGRPYDAIDILEAYLAREPHDARALFLLSDLRQMTGEVDAALEPLLEILRVPPSPEIAERARKRLNLLINAREQQLINAGDLVALVAYFEALVLAEPGWDGHRLKLARWLARSGRTEAAARLLREVGLVGASQAEIDALAREIEITRTALPVERQGGAMYTSAVASGARRTDRFRFLIDTGATMTGLAESRLKALGAELVREGIRVQTANGTAVLPVYRLRELKLGPLLVEDLVVLGFADLPRNADGLLGMDVLSQLSGGLPGAVGRP